MANTPRVASFLASGTEIAVALGLQDSIVAISHECDWPPEVLDRPRLSRPRFDAASMSSGEIDRALRASMTEHGSVYAIDEELLVAVKPDVVLTQGVCEVCAVPTAGVAEVLGRRGIDAKVVSLDAHTVQDILDSIVQVGAATGAAGQAADVVADLEARVGRVRSSVKASPRPRVGRVRSSVKASPRPRVLAMEWLNPPFAPGHWVPEMIDIAGGHNLTGSPGDRSREQSWEDLEGLDPDVLVLMPCGYGLEATKRDADAVADRLARVAPRAIAEGRAFVVDGSAYFNRSGPRFVMGIEILAGLLHPEVFSPPPAGTAEPYGGRAPDSR